MIHIKGNKVTLRTATPSDIENIYFWKYVDEKQEAKKWNWSIYSRKT
ncbi:N-acetyltransferase OS=Lysinibacillus sphaericus OX=1421 GN=LS41612_10485 PE=4 SV=1 [Lysinibacillus sphaericus]